MGTIAAISTPAGVGGIAVVRVSGPDAVALTASICSRDTLTTAHSHTAHLVKIIFADGTLLDEAVATVFRAPHSFTGEDTVELGIHGSAYIQREVLTRLQEAGCRMAEAGEFTRRAFLNGRLDLAQAEGVADLIAAESRAAHRLAASQMKGDFSKRLALLRDRLIEFASLLELELDFSEEDVEFADRSRLVDLCREVKTEVDRLADSFRFGQAFKNGIPVAIAGTPNAGKSTLLNRLLDDERAIVSPVAGTTRDTIEETAVIGGLLFRFIDTAGLHDTDDTVERLGIERTEKALRDASVGIWLLDPTQPLGQQKALLEEYRCKSEGKIIEVYTKSDLQASEGLAISAKTGEGIDELRRRLVAVATEGHDPSAELMVTNARHHEALVKGSEALARALEGLANGLSADFVAQDVREATHYLGAITGTVTTDTLLHSIFSRFCIGK